jgi:hypothetical protein
MKVFPKVINIHLYTNQKETKQFIFLKHHMAPMWERFFTWIIICEFMHINVKKKIHMNFICESMHINVRKIFHMNYHLWINAH